MQRCTCGGTANGGPCPYDVCGVCGRHYTDSGYHARPRRGTNQYPCGCLVISAPKAHAAARKQRRFAQEYERELLKMQQWNAQRAR